MNTKNNNINHWITSDWHLGEDRFKIMQRHGFTNAQDMIDKFVEYHNELVKPDDLVYVVGDVVNLNTPEFLHQVSKFNGRKILFRGNHDRVFSDEELSIYFEKIYQEKEHLEVEIDGKKCFIQHYPSESNILGFNLVGHIHTAWKVQLNMINIGVDCNCFRPHNLYEDIPFLINAITNFYDEDVWVSYSDVNSSYRDTRGKKSRYLDFNGIIGGKK